MPLRLRFLLNTNVLIPLQDSFVALAPSLANFVRLAGVGGHQFLYHPTSDFHPVMHAIFPQMEMQPLWTPIDADQRCPQRHTLWTESVPSAHGATQRKTPSARLSYLRNRPPVLRGESGHVPKCRGADSERSARLPRGRARSAGRRGLAGMAKKLGLLRGRLEVIDA